MKKTITTLACVAILLSACSKKSNDPTPGNDPTPSGIVAINGTNYGTVIIGGQTWTAVNYNGPGGVNYGNSPKNNSMLGKLYTFDEAEAVVLPAGWRLPTTDDFETLEFLADGKSLMSKTSWTIGGGNDSSGFSAKPAGYYNKSSFAGMGTDAVFVSNVSPAATFPYIPHVQSFDVFQISHNGNPVTYAFVTDILTTSTDRGAIRFVKDN